MTQRELEELKAIAYDVMLNAIDNKDTEQFCHGLKLWQDITVQMLGRKASA